MRELAQEYLHHLYLKILSAQEQEPLLCEPLRCQVVLLRARRSAAWRRHFFGATGERKEVERGLCAVARISAVELVPPKAPHHGRQASVPAGGGGDASSPAAGGGHCAAPACWGGDAPPGGGAQEAEAVEEKYWKRRYNFFSRFDEGIAMDPKSWFEVTPETIARHIADRMSICRSICDATAGIGGNAIQFALTPHTSVVCVDVDAQRLEKCERNAEVYGVKERMDFLAGDFCRLPGRPMDAVFISPPWGGPSHLENAYFSLKDVLYCDIIQLFARACRAWSRNVVLYLPRHVDLHELAALAAHFGYPSFEVEKVYFAFPTVHLKLMVVYFGPLFVGDGGFPCRRKPWGVASHAATANPLLCPLPLAGPVYRAAFARDLLGPAIRAVVGARERRVREEEIGAVAEFVRADAATRAHLMALGSVAALALINDCAGSAQRSRKLLLEMRGPPMWAGRDSADRRRPREQTAMPRRH